MPDDSPLIGKTLVDCGFRAKTGITIIAILSEPEPVTGAQPTDVLQPGDTLVTVGKAGQYGAFRRLLSGENALVPLPVIHARFWSAITRRAAASSVAPIALAIGAPCVLASLGARDPEPRQRSCEGH